MPFKHKIASLAAILVGILVSFQGTIAYYNDDLNWCKGIRSLYCPPKDYFAIQDDQFLVVLGIIIACLGVGFYFLNRELSKEQMDRKIVQSA